MGKLNYLGLEKDLWIGNTGVTAMCVYEDPETGDRYCFSGRMGWFRVEDEQVIEVPPPAEFAHLAQPPEWEAYLRGVEGPGRPLRNPAAYSSE